MSLYNYNAIVIDIYDGDTWTLDIDLGFECWLRNQKIRLYGIDTPELRGAEREDGILVRDYCREKWPRGTKILLRSIKDSKGKYGRWLGYLIDLKSGININDHLVSGGMARDYQF